MLEELHIRSAEVFPFKIMTFINLYNIKLKLNHMKNLTVRDVKVIRDQDRLLEIIMNRNLDSRVRHAAVDNIEDKSFFKDCAYDEDEFLRIFAAQYIDDDETLLDLVLNDSNDYVRYKAGVNFVDNCDSERYEDVLLEFALENPAYNVSPYTKTHWVAESACDRINDTSKLLKIINESQSEYVCSTAIRRVDREALAGLLYGENLGMKKKLKIAMELEDDERLMELLEVPIGPTRKYVPNDGDFPDDVSGIWVMGNLSPGDSIYRSIVLSYPNEEIVIQALNDIQYKSNLEFIIKHHESPKIRDLARKRLEHIR